MPVSQKQLKERARIAKALGEIGFALPGSLTDRRFTCTRAGCHCHFDPWCSAAPTSSGAERLPARP